MLISHDANQTRVCLFPSKCAFGKWRCMLPTDVTTLAHAELHRRGAEMIGTAQTNTSAARANADILKKQHADIIEIARQKLTVQKNNGKTKKTEQWVSVDTTKEDQSRAEQGLLFRVVMSLYSIHARDNSRCRGIWLPSSFIVAPTGHPRLLEIPITLTFRSLRRNHILSLSVRKNYSSKISDGL